MADEMRKSLNYDRADKKIKEWVAKGNSSLPLDLSKLDLKSSYDENPNVIIELPKNLKVLICRDNPMLRRLPKLPKGLQQLLVINNNLITLPELPDSLIEIDCRDNRIKSLPKLPNKLQYLRCDRNKLLRLPELPVRLLYLNCYDNVLTELPEIHSELENLICSENMLKSLPKLPKIGLVSLDCRANELTSLPELPDTLRELNCEFNKLKTLPKIPKSLTELYCTYNNLTSTYQEICENMSDDIFNNNNNNNDGPRGRAINRINKLIRNHPKHQSEIKSYIDSSKISKFIKNERGIDTDRHILEYLNSSNLKDFNVNSLKPSTIQRKVLRNRGYTRKNNPTKPGKYTLVKRRY